MRIQRALAAGATWGQSLYVPAKLVCIPFSHQKRTHTHTHQKGSCRLKPASCFFTTTILKGMKGPVTVRGAWHLVFRSRSYHALGFSPVYPVLSVWVFHGHIVLLQGEISMSARSYIAQWSGCPTHGSAHFEGNGRKGASHDV